MLFEKLSYKFIVLTAEGTEIDFTNTKDHSRLKFVTWVQKLYPVGIVLSVSLIFRGFLWILPGIGRDEALYWYWSHHPEFAYAPLLQLMIRIVEFLPFSPNLNIRFSSLIAGSLVIVLMDLLLKERGASREYRLLWGLLLGISPWMLYSGAIVHPDMWLMTMILLFIYLIEKQFFQTAALVAGLAIWAKPTGLLLVGFAITCWLWMIPLAGRKRFFCMTINVAIALPVLLFANKDMIQGISEFAKITDAPSILSIAVIQFLALIGLAGPGLIIASISNLAELKNAIAQLLRDKGVLSNFQQQPAAAIGVLFLGTFFTAMIFNGQLKANWTLPALIMPVLITHKHTRIPFTRFSILSAVVCSVGLVLLMTRPTIITFLEYKIPDLAQSYRMQAGSREAKVSAAVGWSDRLNEYQTLRPFSDRIKVYWQKHNPDNAMPVWILSDDYGLAAQLLFVWRSPETKMWITNDPLFRCGLPPQKSKLLQMPGIIMQVYHDSREYYPDLKALSPVKLLPHPYAGRSIRVGIYKRF